MYKNLSNPLLTSKTGLSLFYKDMVIKKKRGFNYNNNVDYLRWRKTDPFQLSYKKNKKFPLTNVRSSRHRPVIGKKTPEKQQNK